jgi:hypothetical protein
MQHNGDALFGKMKNSINQWVRCRDVYAETLEIQIKIE